MFLIISDTSLTMSTSVTLAKTKMASPTSPSVDGISSECFSDGAFSDGEGSLANSVVGHAQRNWHAPKELNFPLDSADKTIKVRKQRSLKSNTKQHKPLCLDYLNGTCHRLRSYCRYYHPRLTELLQEEKEEVCEVWLLSGFCKFGENCWKQHPTMSPETFIRQFAAKKTAKEHADQCGQPNRDSANKSGGSATIGTETQSSQRMAKKTANEHADQCGQPNRDSSNESGGPAGIGPETQSPQRVAKKTAKEHADQCGQPNRDSSNKSGGSATIGTETQSPQRVAKKTAKELANQCGQPNRDSSNESGGPATIGTETQSPQRVAKKTAKEHADQCGQPNRDSSNKSGGPATIGTETQSPQRVAKKTAKELANQCGQPNRDSSNESGGPATIGMKAQHDDKTLRKAMFLFDQLKTDPERAVSLLFQSGVPYDELLPLLHAKTLSDSRTSQCYVKFIMLLRQSLPAGQHQYIDQLFLDTVASSITRTLEMDLANPRSAVVLRARGVRNVQVLTEALLCALVAPEQIAGMVSMLSTKLETHSAQHQDLQVLLLSHLLGAVCHSYRPAAAEYQYIERFVHSSCMQWDTEIALNKLLFLRAQGITDEA